MDKIQDVIDLSKDSILIYSSNKNIASQTIMQIFSSVRWSAISTLPCGTSFPANSSLFYHFPSIISKWGKRDTIGKDMGMLNTDAILFLDEFGTELGTSLSKDFIINLLNYRIGNNLQTIISTSLKPEVIKERYGEELSDLLDDKFKTLQVQQ